MEKNSLVNIGGNVENALTGNYKIDVQAVLREAWLHTQQSRKPINLGIAFCFFLTGFIMYAGASYLGINLVSSAEQDLAPLSLINLVATVLVAPFIAGVEMMGILKVIGVQTEPRLVFAFLRRSSWVALVTLISSLLISLGQILILPAIFFFVSLSLVVPLVIEKRVSPMQAIVLSIKALRFQWFKVFALYLVLSITLLLLSLPTIVLTNAGLGIVGLAVFALGLSYLIPMYYYVKGILYREIFGMKIQQVNADALNSHGRDDIFSA